MIATSIPVKYPTLVLSTFYVLLLAHPARLPAAEPSSSMKIGALIASEDFSQPDATAKWRWGAGRWTVADGVLKGTETKERIHAAGIACQRTYHDAVIQFRVQFAGGSTAYLLLRNKFGNLCRVTITLTDMKISKDKPNSPADTPEKTVVLDKAALQLKPGKWYTVIAVVQGEEFTATLQDHATLKGRHPGIDVEKTEIEFLANGDSILFDDLKANALEPS